MARKGRRLARGRTLRLNIGRAALAATIPTKSWAAAIVGYPLVILGVIRDADVRMIRVLAIVTRIAIAVIVAAANNTPSQKLPDQLGVYCQL